MTGIRLFVGLGNPGNEYARTRHNAGFWFLDALAEHLGARLGTDSKLQSENGKATLAGQAIWLLKPNTFMNKSGQAVVAAQRYFKIAPEETLLAHDDLDLPPGTSRLKFDGGHGGQNGLRDTIAHLGNGCFYRLRLGIGHPGHKDQVTPWVLGRPGKDDEDLIRSSIARSLSIAADLATGEFEKAMRLLHTAK
ncbi:MAG: aminoacyl-tRNA hydrolase [Pseudomonadota bacterium]|nr:aminoacyl-tRNA hydrolase [Pseudomonadota bacterium]